MRIADFFEAEQKLGCGLKGRPTTVD